MVEIIVKYVGNLASAAETLGGSAELLSGSFAIVTLPKDKLDDLYSLDEIIYAELPKRLYFMRLSSLKNACVYDAPTVNGTSLDGEGTLVGIIDSGIDIDNAEFKTDTGQTRIAAALDLSEGGLVLTGDDINNALQENVRLLSDNIGHGTAVAGIACGKRGIAPKAELVVVKLGTGDGYATSVDIMRGLRFIKATAEDLNRPVAINLSYGTNDGSHDGSSLLDEYINEVADTTVCSVCIASGNEGAAGHHFAGNFKDKSIAEFNVGGNISSMYMSIWKSFADNAGLLLTAPNGDKSGLITQNASFVTDNTTVNIIFLLPTPYNIDTEIYINLSAQGQIAQGIWSLELVPMGEAEGSFDIWLPVTEAVGEKTFFLEADTDTSLTLPSTAYKAITVGGYNQLTDTALSFSGRGYTRNTGFIKPDLAAPAYNIQAPALGGGIDSFTGTSLAAPHVTGIAALIMQWGIVLKNDAFMYGERLKAYLRKGATRYDGTEYPNRIFGYGTVCLDNTLKLIQDKKKDIFIQQTADVMLAALSEEYLDFVGRQSSYLYNLHESDNTAFCRIDESFYIMYIKRDYYKLNKTMLTNTLGIRQPFLMGLTDYAEALSKSGITSAQTQPYLNLRGNGILIAIIDTGINYKDEAFIFEDGTSKIKYLWNQDEAYNCGSICFGREYTSDDINLAIKGEINIGSDDIGHGTYLAELAAGRNGAAPDSELIVVKLKQAKAYLKEEMFIDADVPAFESSDLMLGVNYAYEKARELKMPIVICIGVGTNQGGHTGQTSLEEYLSLVAKRYSVCICAAAGNEGLAKHHTSVSLNEGDDFKTVELTVDSNEAGVNVWIWNFIVNTVAVEIVSPLGETVSKIQPIANYENSFTLPRGGGSVEVKYYLPEDIASDQYTQIRLIKPAMGIWTIRVYNNNASSGTVHMWLPMSGFIKDGTFFLDSEPAVTVTNPGTANTVMTVGGYNSSDNSIYAPTGRGPTRFYMLRPYFAAPAVNLNGRSGTSYACAIACGAAALLFEWLILRNKVYTANTITVTAQLVLGAQGGEGNVYPNNTWGYGRMDLYASFQSF